MNEEFEKHCRSKGIGEPFPERDRSTWNAAWQASRKQAVKEAASACDRLSTRLGDLANPSDCAEAIRALQKT